MNFDDWNETTTPARGVERFRERHASFAGGIGSVRLYDSDDRKLAAHMIDHPYGGTASTVLNLQASWQTDERARRIAAIFAAHADEICAEIDALDDLPANANVVAETLDRR